MRNSGDEFVLKGIELRSLRKLLFILVLLLPCTAQLRRQFSRSALGAKKCAQKGHKWHDVGAVVLRSDGSVDELPRGTMQRCRRCGLTRDPNEG